MNIYDLLPQNSMDCMENFVLHYLLRDGLEVIEPDQTHAIHYNQDSIRNSNICHTITKYLEKKGREKYSSRKETMQNTGIMSLILQSL